MHGGQPSSTRLDGWPNRDLNVGGIVSMAPDLSAFTTLLDVVNHYNNFKRLNLTENEKRDLVEYLKSL